MAYTDGKRRTDEGLMTMTTMYLPNVYMLHERGTGVAARPIKPTLAEAQAVLDAEIAKIGKPPLEWREEFGGAYAQRGELAYEVTPVEVDLPDGDLGMVCDAYGLPHSAVALARHLVANAEETIGNWKLVAEIRQRRMAEVQAVVPEDCWVTRSSEATCLDLVGGRVGGEDGAEFTIEMGCLPCRVRGALGEVPPLPEEEAVERVLALAQKWDEELRREHGVGEDYTHTHAREVRAAVGEAMPLTAERMIAALDDALAESETIARALDEAADEMPTGSGSTTEYWDGVRVQYRLYEDSPEDKTPQAWLRNRAAQVRGE